MLNQKLIKRLEKFYKKYDMFGEKVTVEQLSNAEKVLQIKLHEDYVDFVTRFGGAYAGIDIYAFEKNQNIITITESMRKTFSKVAELTGELNSSVVISDDGSGNPILINSNGEVVIYDHDNGEREVLSKNLGQYIEDNFEEW